MSCAEVRAYGERGLQTLPFGIREGHLCWAVPCPLCQLRPCPLYLSSTQLSVPVASACRQTDIRLISVLLHTQEESLRIIFMHLIIGFLSLPCKVFIGTLNPLFNTCVYTVCIYSIFLVRVLYMGMHSLAYFPLGFLSCPIGK